MMMNEKQFQNLLLKFQQGLCTWDEKAMLEDWVSFGVFEGKVLSDEDLELRLLNVASRLPLSRPGRWLWPKVIVAAAVALLVVAAGLFFYADKTGTSSNTREIVAGKISGTLTLADGRKIRLTDAKNGEVATAAGVMITKRDGQLIYKINKNVVGKEGFNTLSTAKGETYKILLSDGSVVILNAESSLIFTTSLYNTGLRKVSLRGEAYFEIAKDKQHPFVVKTINQEVEVLGTHFNISSYIDKAETATTLLEGAVKVSGAMGSRILKPGQQALLSSKSITLQEVEVEDAVAWKNGYFVFNSELLESIMNKIARWYNVTLIYEDPLLKKETFFGRVSRSENIEKVLKKLEGTDVVRFEVDGRLIKIKRLNSNIN